MATFVVKKRRTFEVDECQKKEVIEHSRKLQSAFVSMVLSSHLVILSSHVVIPIITLILYSFLTSNRGYVSLRMVSLNAYRELASDVELRKALFSSVYVGVLSATISVFIGGLAAFGVRGRGGLLAHVIRALTLAPLVLPEVVFGLGLLTWFKLLRMSLGVVSLVTAHVTFSVSYNFMTVSEPNSRCAAGIGVL